MQICLAFKRTNKKDGWWRRFLYYLIGFTLIHVEIVFQEPCTKGTCENCKSLSLETDPERRKLVNPKLNIHMISYTAIDAKPSLKTPSPVCMTRKIDRPYDEHYTFLNMQLPDKQVLDMKSFLNDQQDKKYKIRLWTKLQWIVTGLYSRCSCTCFLCCRQRPDSTFSYDEVYSHSQAANEECWHCSDLVAAALRAGKISANGFTIDTLYASVVATNPYITKPGHLDGMNVFKEEHLLSPQTYKAVVKQSSLPIDTKSLESIKIPRNIIIDMPTAIPAPSFSLSSKATINKFATGRQVSLLSLVPRLPRAPTLLSTPLSSFSV